MSNTRLYGCFGKPKTKGLESFYAISGAKIGLSINIVNDVKFYHSDRFMNNPACGAFNLAKRAPGYELLFEDGKEVKYFDNADEFFELADYYLRNDKEREAIAQAGMKRDMALSEDYLIAVRASVPPYPHADADGERRGMPIIGLNPESMKHIYLTDAYMEDGDYKYAGSDGVVLKATAHGRDVSEARNRVYRTLNNLTIQDMQFRQDIGARVSNDMRMLKEWGWL